METDKPAHLAITLIEFGRVDREFPGLETLAIVGEIDSNENNSILEVIRLSERQLANLGFNELAPEDIHEDQTLKIVFGGKTLTAYVRASYDSAGPKGAGVVISQKLATALNISKGDIIHLRNPKPEQSFPAAEVTS